MATERKEKEQREMPQKIFVYFGPPTSGKTTQAIFLQETMRADRVLARDVIPGLADEFETTRDIIPDEVFIPALKSKLDSLRAGTVIFDNLPRTALQAKELVTWCNLNGVQLHAVRLMLTEQEVCERAAGRQVCATCGESYHQDLKPSKELNRCDHDNTPLIRKKGDNPDTVRKGVREYYEREANVLEAISEQCEIHKIPAEGSVFATSRRMFTDLSPSLFADPNMGGEYFRFRDVLASMKVPHIFFSGMPVFVYGGRALMKDFDILVPDDAIDTVANELGKNVEEIRSDVANTRYFEVSPGTEVVSNLEVTTDRQIIPFSFQFVQEGSRTLRFMSLPCNLMGVEDLILFKTGLGRFGQDQWGKMKDDLSDDQGLIGVQNINWDLLRRRSQEIGMEERLVKKLEQLNVTPPWRSNGGQPVYKFY